MGLHEISKRWLNVGGFDTFAFMPVPQEPPKAKPLQQIVQDVALYPLEAFLFVEQGLANTIKNHNGELQQSPEECTGRHVSGQDLCDGLRDLALRQWGLLARTVLQRWNIDSTLDFGRIVFALIEGGRMQKTDEDTIEDFRNVFDFRSAFDGSYRIEHKS